MSFEGGGDGCDGVVIDVKGSQIFFWGEGYQMLINENK